MNLTSFGNEEIYSSIYLVEQINIFRKEEGIKAELLHKSFIAKIESEFDEEIRWQNILPSKYSQKMPTGGTKEVKCYSLNFEQSLQILMTESKVVRRRVVEVLKAQHEKIQELQVVKLPTTYLEALKELVVSQELIEQQQLVISEQAPKVLAFENIIDSANTYTLDTASDILNIGRTTLCKLLEAKKWKTVREQNGTSSTRFAEENGYAKTLYEYVNIGRIEKKVKRFVLRKIGLDKLIAENQKANSIINNQTITLINQ